MWARSTHGNKLNSALHDCCRIITGCLKPINIDSLCLLAGTAPLDIRRTVASCTERSRQVADTKHQLHNHVAAASRLKSLKSFTNTTKPLNSSPSGTRLEMSEIRLQETPAVGKMELLPVESLPAWSDQPCLCRWSLKSTEQRRPRGSGATVTRRSQ